MLLFLAGVAAANLQPGDDPYAILGVSREASAREIRAAYRQLAFELHPDRNRRPDSDKVWSRINDAYEILSSPDQKDRFDRTGHVIDPPIQPQRRHETGAYSAPSEFRTPLITEQLFPQLSADGAEWLIFIFQHFDCPTCKAQLEIWEEAAKFLRDYTSVGRMDATQSPSLCESLGVAKVPTLVAVRRSDGRYRTARIARSLGDVPRALAVVYGHWRARVETAVNVGKWIRKNRGKVCVVLYAPFSAADPFVDFRFAAAQIGTKCAFAHVNGGADWNISLYRAGELAVSTAVKLRGKAIVEEIGDRSSPLFAKLTHKNYAESCGEWCIGVVSESIRSDLVKEYHDLPFVTVQIVVESEFAREVNATTHDWVVFLGNRGWKKPADMERNSLFVIL
jgi:thiol-disulfide isomerase/thioredoxin